MIQVQLSLIIVGLFLALPFVVTNEYVPEGGIVGNFTDSTPPWVGTIEMEEAWIWTDNMLMLIMGGLPWQVYFQRKCSIDLFSNSVVTKNSLRTYEKSFIS